MDTYDFTVNTPYVARDVVETVGRHGIAHLPGYLDPSCTASIADECRALLAADEHWITPLEYSVGRSVRVERMAIASATVYVAVYTTYSSGFMREVAEGHMGGADYQFNYDLYVAYDVEGSDHFAHRMHYDRVPHLKFFLYLTDVDDRTGPLCVVPGSHGFAPRVQSDNRRIGIVPTEDETRILPEEFKSRGVRVNGPAGTLLVFNSDIVHSATHITSGERLVIRSRCIEPRYLDAVRRQRAAGQPAS
jgi:Phytanoyl-CoA dioxygenase (PhyH)